MSSAEEPKKAKNIGMTTSWRVRCGIATFSEQLSQAYASHGRKVYINRIHRWGDKHPGYFNWLAARTPDEVDACNVQHEYGLFQGKEEAFYETLKARGFPIVTEMHSAGFTALDKIILGFSDKVIVHNRYCLGLLPRNEKTIVLPHPVPKRGQLLPVEKARTSTGLPLNKKLVGMFGFVTEAKGHEIAIRAMAKMPEEYALVIAGGWHVEQETAFYNNMRALSARLLGPRGLWIGYIPPTRLAEVFSALDLVLMPYLRMTESGALMTALAYGKPVLGSPLDPFKEKAEKGLVAVYAGEDDIPGAIESLLADEAALKGLRWNAERYTKENSYRRVAAKHLEIFDSLVKDN